MMKDKNWKKSEQIGMPLGTASNRLRKMILFKLVCESKNNICFQCEEEIISIDEFTIEHKVPYLNSVEPTKLFFDLNNIGFSHHKCNVGASRKTKFSHPSETAYNRGCRCRDCTTLKVESVDKYRQKKKRSRSIVVNAPLL